MNKIVKTIATATLLSGIVTSTCYAYNISSIEGDTRFETASLIADKMEEYKSVILVNGYSMADGLSASGLSGASDAPILLTKTNELPIASIEAINKADTVYIIGGENVVSKEVENELVSMGKAVKRIGGINRYETSEKVADEIESLKGIQELFYVNGITGFADAMSISPVASNSGNPVILTNGLSTLYRKDVESYTIGGYTAMDSSFDSFSYRISGSDRYETNKNVINQFFKERKHLYLSKSHELIDALTVSSLKEPVVLVAKGSDKSIIAGADELTALGGIDRDAVNEAKSYLYGDSVVFYGQHQDDETLFAGSAIVDAIESVGADNVYLVLITDGCDSGVANYPRYRGLTKTEFSTLRDNEYKAAVKALGVKEGNVILLDQPEDKIDINIVRGTMIEFENKLENVTHVTHSYKYDFHPQHLQTGRTLHSLYNEGLIEDCRFFGRNNKVLSAASNDIYLSRADNYGEREKVLAACKEYERDDKDMIREGIGYKSVRNLFNILTKDTDVRSYLHGPSL